MDIRLAKPSDARSLLDIYAPYIENTAITFEYDWAVELSVYVSQDARGKGVGSKLYDELEDLLDQMGYMHFLACISLPNEASLALHRKRGYQQVAHFPKIGYKFENWHDIVWLQKSLDKQAKPIKPLKEMEWK